MKTFYLFPEPWDFKLGEATFREKKQETGKENQISKNNKLDETVQKSTDVGY